MNIFRILLPIMRLLSFYNENDSRVCAYDTISGVYTNSLQFTECMFLTHGFHSNDIYMFVIWNCKYTICKINADYISPMISYTHVDIKLNPLHNVRRTCNERRLYYSNASKTIKVYDVNSCLNATISSLLLDDYDEIVAFGNNDDTLCVYDLTQSFELRYRLYDINTGMMQSTLKSKGIHCNSTPMQYSTIYEFNTGDTGRLLDFHANTVTTLAPSPFAQVSKFTSRVINDHTIAMCGYISNMAMTVQNMLYDTRADAYFNNDMLSCKQTMACFNRARACVFVV